MAADDRSGPVSGLSSSPKTSVRADNQHSATFEVVGWHIELSASPGFARLAIAGNQARYTQLVEPRALAEWAIATTKLLTLRPADSARGRAAIRAPFLLDREARPSIAFEALVSEQSVGYRLLIDGDATPLTTLVTTADVVRGMVQAAAGIGRLAQPSR